MRNGICMRGQKASTRLHVWTKTCRHITWQPIFPLRAATTRKNYLTFTTCSNANNRNDNARIQWHMCVYVTEPCQRRRRFRLCYLVDTHIIRIPHLHLCMWRKIVEGSTLPHAIHQTSTYTHMRHTYACSSHVSDLWPLICTEINYFIPISFLLRMAKS